MLLECCSQILVVFSTSDFLVNTVLASVIKSFQMVVSYLCEVKCGNVSSGCGNSQPTVEMLRNDVAASRKNIEPLACNCAILCNTIESIVRIRLLDNFSSISPHIKKLLNRTLNEIFINLTDSLPLVAIQFSKIVQLVSIEWFENFFFGKLYAKIV
jgi:hypothetical protein